MHESKRLPRTQAVELTAQLRQGAQGCEIPEVQLKAAKQTIHRIVAVDDDIDGCEAQIGFDGLGLERLRRTEGRRRGRHGKRRPLIHARNGSHSGDDRDQTDLQKDGLAL
jgi:hypothetical protein